MKKVHSVYLNEQLHGIASDQVERALAKKGSLVGFIRFIERAAFEAFGKPEAQEDRFQGWHQNDTMRSGDEAFRELQQLPAGALIEPIDRYLGVWDKAILEMPWVENNPAACHFLQLSALRARRLAWNSRHQRMNPIGNAPSPIQVDFGSNLIQAVAEAVGWIGARSTQNTKPKTSKPEDHWFFDPGTPLWRRNRLDVTWEDPSSNVSFYLEPESHTFVVNQFGNAMVEFAESTLRSVFGNPNHWLDIEPEVTLLTYGPNAFTTEALVEAAKSLSEWGAGHVPGSPFQSFLEELEHLDAPSWTFFGFAHPPGVPQHFIDIFRLGRRLGLINQPGDVTALNERLPGAFMARYGLNVIQLDYPTIETILAHHSPKPIQFFTAAEFHVWELFRLYAQDVLPRGLGEKRLVGSTLATLSQPWVTPIQTGLEKFSSGKIEVSKGGTYTISKSRRVIASLTHEEAATIARILWLLVSMDPDRSDARNDSPDAPSAFGLLQRPRRDLDGYWKPYEPISFELGEPFIEKAVQTLRDTNLHPAKTGHRLVAWLFDNALGGSGEVEKKILDPKSAYSAYFHDDWGRL